MSVRQRKALDCQKEESESKWERERKQQRRQPPNKKVTFSI